VDLEILDGTNAAALYIILFVTASLESNQE